MRKFRSNFVEPVKAVIIFLKHKACSDECAKHGTWRERHVLNCGLIKARFTWPSLRSTSWSFFRNPAP
ncbi:MAG: hypothetical protein COB36_12995 [Alphaproteobacteria bacterium]|nr:MAG: hypothetical protein COB36_12995 [Alphaproteobacteria bacterium]